MYTQIIIIFVILGIFAVLHAVTIAMILKLRKEGTEQSNKCGKIDNAVRSSNKGYNKKPYSDNSGAGIVFCKNCSAPFSAKYGVCPKCGTPK